MERRHLNHLVVAAPALAWLRLSHAQNLASLSDLDATRGLKAALETGAMAAVRLLGVENGFLGNPKVRIPLPSGLQEASKLLKALGQGKQVEELEVGINRAAEGAVPLAKDLLVKAVNTMTVQDAKNILTGGETSVTQFFAGRTREPLTGQFLPVVRRVVSRIGLAQKYDRLAGKAAGMGLVKQEDASIDHYVTRKSLDGLYLIIGEEEKKIRQDPVGTGSAILQKVFGALKR